MSTRMLLLLFMLTVLPTVRAEDWPAFRGPMGNGVATGTGYPTEWSSEKNIKWRTPLPGPGNGSPIVVGNQVFVLCALDQGRERITFCFDRETGKELWQQTVRFDKVEETHKTNPYCPSTPVSDGSHVFVWHRSAGMHCYDLTGKAVWSRDLGEFRHIWGGGSSPILYEDLVIQLCGPGERTFVIAMSKQTGETVWETPIEPGGSASDKGKYIGTWSTPVITQIDGAPQLICPLHSRVVSYEPESGKELWSLSGLSSDRGDLSYASPMIGESHAVVVGGFGGPAFGFKLGGEGDVTESNRLWIHNEMRNPQRIGSGIVIDETLFLANADNPGSLQCINILTGEELWKVPRTEEGPHWGSMVLADGNLYVTGQKGITRVFKPNKGQYEEVALNHLEEQCNSTPAFSNQEIFLRTWDALYCVSGNE